GSDMKRTSAVAVIIQAVFPGSMAGASPTDSTGAGDGVSGASWAVKLPAARPSASNNVAASNRAQRRGATDEIEFGAFIQRLLLSLRYGCERPVPPAKQRPCRHQSCRSWPP